MEAGISVNSVRVQYFSSTGRNRFGGYVLLSKLMSKARQILKRSTRSPAESELAFDELRFLPGSVSTGKDQVALRERASDEFIAVHLDGFPGEVLFLKGSHSSPPTAAQL